MKDINNLPNRFGILKVSENRTRNFVKYKKEKEDLINVYSTNYSHLSATEFYKVYIDQKIGRRSKSFVDRTLSNYFPYHTKHPDKQEIENLVNLYKKHRDHMNFCDFYAHYQNEFNGKRSLHWVAKTLSNRGVYKRRYRLYYS